MLWIKTVVHTTTAGIEPVSGILLLNGINGYEVCDSEDFNSFLENKEVYFDYIEDDLLKLKDCETTVTFYVPENSQGLETILGVKNALAGLKERDAENAFWDAWPSDTDTRLEEEDWENNWKQYFKPFPVGERLMIKPSWETLPEGTNRTVVEIDPSSSFGIGSHTTTRLCLEEIDKTLAGMAEPSKIYMLDMGCGSGILGIAAIKLGAGHVNAVDIDQNSARIAAENYKVNGIDSTQYNVYAGDILKIPLLPKPWANTRMTSLPPISWRTSLSGWRRRSRSSWQRTERLSFRESSPSEAARSLPRLSETALR